MGAAALQSQSVLLNFNIQHDIEVTELHIRWVLILEGHVLQYTRKCPFWGLFLNFETTIFFVLLKYYNFLPFFGSSLSSSFPFFAKHPWSAAHSTKQYIAVRTYVRTRPRRIENVWPILYAYYIQSHSISNGYVCVVARFAAVDSPHLAHTHMWCCVWVRWGSHSCLDSVT